jgi:PAS domain S-box-containing protein
MNAMSTPTAEQLYSAFFERAHHGCVIADWNGRFVKVNQAFADILESTIDETLGLTYKQFTPEQYYESDKRQLTELKARGYYDWFFKHYYAKNGDKIRVRLCLFSIVVDDIHYIGSLVEKINTVGYPNLGKDEIPPDQLTGATIEEKRS